MIRTSNIMVPAGKTLKLHFLLPPPTWQSTYALVAAKGDHGVQVIDITNPYAPTNASAPTDGSNGFTKLNGPESIAIIAGSPEYALVAAKGDNGTQIIKINTGSIFESNNQNPAYAKAGDTLRVAFAVDDVFTSDAATFTAKSGPICICSWTNI